MEQNSWRRLGRRGWILVVVPVLAGALAVVLGSDRPRDTQASVVVVGRPPALDTLAAPQYVAAFQATLRSVAVLDQVSKSVGMTTSRLSQGLGTQTSAPGSSTILVSFRDPDPRTAAQVAESLAQKTLVALVGPAQASVDRRLTVLKEQAAEQDKESAAIAAEAGTALPLDDYRGAVTEANSLEVAYQTSRARGATSSEVAALRRAADAATQEVARLRPFVARFQAIDSARQRTLADLQNAEIDDLVASSSASESNSGGTVLAAGSKRESLLPWLAPVVAPVVVLALLLSLGLLLLLNVVNPPRARRRRGPEQVGDEPARTLTSPLLP